MRKLGDEFGVTLVAVGVRWLAEEEDLCAERIRSGGSIG